MPCYKPLIAYRLDGQITFNKPFVYAKGFNLPCGRCTGCRIEHSRQWATRLMHEQQMHEQSCFITLTFNQHSLEKRKNPYTVDRTEFQKFMKRLRKKTGKKLSYFHCGEYGDLNKRPHYHAIIYGHDFSDKEQIGNSNGIPLYVSSQLEDLWSDPKTKESLGFHRIGKVSFESAAYVARYCMKKWKGEGLEEHYQIIDDDGVIHDRHPEYATMSTKPAIGKRWYEKYGWTDCHANDYVTIPRKDGKRIIARPPRAYDKWFCQCPAEQETKCKCRLSELKKKRILAQNAPIQDNHPDTAEMQELWRLMEVKSHKLGRLIRNL